MALDFVYELGKKSPLRFKSDNIDNRLKFVEYKYTSEAVTGAAVTSFLVCMILAFLFFAFEITFLVYFFFFIGMILGIAFYVYPVNIIYSQRLIQYSEEMLKAIMRISTFVQMNMSLEYAIVNTGKELRGTLRTQLLDIAKQLKLRKVNTLGEVLEQYIPIWNSVNPDFVKSLKLLETATLSGPKDRKSIIKEVMESLIISYHTSGKRFAEELAAKAKTLIAIGVLFPIISLMLLPLVSIFLPNLLSPALLFFIYDVFFPTLILLMALDFSSKRIQVDTIDLKESPFWKKVPNIYYILSVLIAVILAIPAMFHLSSINTAVEATVQREYEFLSVFNVWLLTLGIVVAVALFAHYYTRKYEKLWNEVDETEQDLPHLLQTLSTYLTLNLSIESIIPEIVQDYKTHGFSKHPVVKFFSELVLKLKTSKKNAEELVKKVLPKICPSKKVVNILTSVMGFTDISQKSAANAAKMIREQIIAISRLDDYIKTLLSETVALINITTAFLAPILCAAAVLMSLAIVKSLTFISRTLEGIQSAFGGTATPLNLVDITQIIPPTIIELIVGIYLIELILVLAVFQSNVRIGSDPYQLMKTIKSSMVGFGIYTIILLGGFFIAIELLFQQVLVGG